MRSRRAFKLGTKRAPLASSESPDEAVEELLQAFFDLGRDLAGSAYRFEQFWMGSAQFPEHRGFEPAHIRDCHRIEISAGTGEDLHHLLFDRNRLELWLLQELGQSAAAAEQALRRRVEI